MRGPITPVCEEEPCEEPAAGITLRFTRSDTVVAWSRPAPPAHGEAAPGGLPGHGAAVPNLERR